MSTYPREQMDAIMARAKREMQEQNERYAAEVAAYERAERMHRWQQHREDRNHQEWAVELHGRLRRARALVELGLPDPGFRLLAEEIKLFASLAQRRAAG